MGKSSSQHAMSSSHKEKNMKCRFQSAIFLQSCQAGSSWHFCVVGYHHLLKLTSLLSAHSTNGALWECKHMLSCISSLLCLWAHHHMICVTPTNHRHHTGPQASRLCFCGFKSTPTSPGNLRHGKQKNKYTSQQPFPKKGECENSIKMARS